MGLKFSPLVYAGFVPTGSGGGPSPGSPYFGDPVENVGDLPVSGVDGEIRVVKSTGSIYMWDADDNRWELITAPTQDVQPQTVVVPDSATFTVVPGMTLAADVNAAQAIVDIVNDVSGVTEMVVLAMTKTSTIPAKTEERTGEVSGMDFEAVLNGSSLQLNYKTLAGINTYTLRFRAVTVY